MCISLFLFCIGYAIGLIFEIEIDKASVTNFSLACISILAIGGTIFNFIIEQVNKSKMSIPSYLKLFIWKTDILTYEICIGIPLALIMIITNLLSQFTIGFILVISYCIISFLYILFYNYIYLQSKIITNHIWEVVASEIVSDKNVYYDYNESCFFTKSLTTLLSSENIIPSTERELFDKYVDLVQVHATPIFNKIGSTSVNLDLKLLTYYLYDYIDIYKYGLRNISPNDEEDWRIYQLRHYIKQMILNCKKYNDFFLMIHVYNFIIGTSIRDYERALPILSKEKPLSKIDHVMKLFLPDNLYLEHVSDHRTNPFIKLSYFLAIIECLMSTIRLHFCNDIYNEFDDKTTEINTTIEYSNYLKQALFRYKDIYQSKYPCIPVYIISSFVLLLNSTQFRSWETKAPAKINSFVNDLVRQSLIQLINLDQQDFLKNVDDSLDDFYFENKKPLLFNSIYSWRDFFSDEKHYFEFIVGMIVIIDLKFETVEFKEIMLNNLESQPFRHIDNSKENIIYAILKTIDIWSYSEDMKKILNEYLDKNKQ